MIEVHIRMVMPLAKRGEVERTLRARIGPTRALRGCLDCRVYRELDDEKAVVFAEWWHDRALWQRHALSAWFREVLSLVELSSQPPEIVFRRIDAVWGLPYLTELHRESESCPRTWQRDEIPQIVPRGSLPGPISDPREAG